ncbi:hypothetical protein B0T24DRAFT_112857 [Lasiosphaeria ovina]|uniref:Uncharacterized protein n=1 Tax=Lasiosphaeria ovina TaxID=92902 RepID=A0AAE0MZ47_9PEZI|nr:hypothetical protein B0T24DRAFT_112857 [Lasiosphaeria ovina]
MEEVGTLGETPLQIGDISRSPSRSIPPHFVWRLHGGRRSSTTSLTETPEATGRAVGDMAVDVPVLRDSFDPWGSHEKEDDDNGRCKACARISRARAAAHLPMHHDLPSHGECLDLSTSNMFRRAAAAAILPCFVPSGRHFAATPHAVRFPRGAMAPPQSSTLLATIVPFKLLCATVGCSTSVVRFSQL